MIGTERMESAPETLYRWHTVLIVDDEAEVLSALRRLLDREPYDVITTDRPALALEWMERKNISLAISDQRMPEMDGDLFLEGVWKKSPRTARLLLTGYPDSIGEIPRSRRVLVRVMAKPWNDGMLKRTIRHLLRERESEMD
ncbi:MAG TPA: response regulator [Planctomycetota bacterium]|nr:response regulator [Planctomycetota bacterium]